MGISATGMGLLSRMWNCFVFGVELVELSLYGYFSGAVLSLSEQARIDEGINDLSTHVPCSLPTIPINRTSGWTMTLSSTWWVTVPQTFCSSPSTAVT